MMDYLLRDTYFTGVEYGKVDIQRVIDSLDFSPDGQPDARKGGALCLRGSPDSEV